MIVNNIANVKLKQFLLIRQINTDKVNNNKFFQEANSIYMSNIEIMSNFNSIPFRMTLE